MVKSVTNFLHYPKDKTASHNKPPKRILNM
uniref:Uncharacterized protein n=1 Tax=Anguilla anguilla TaxID=7936 RepID=A0A0E9RH72_ANGAN